MAVLLLFLPLAYESVGMRLLFRKSQLTRKYRQEQEEIQPKVGIKVQSLTAIRRDRSAGIDIFAGYFSQPAA